MKMPPEYDKVTGLNHLLLMCRHKFALPYALVKPEVDRRIFLAIDKSIGSLEQSLIAVTNGYSARILDNVFTVSFML